MSDHYVLDGTIPVPESDLIPWARWYEQADRHIARTEIAEGVEVSTVFLGLNHQWGKGPPLLFETMVFGGPMDEAQERYSTWHEAEQGHEAMCARVREAIEAQRQQLWEPPHA